VQGLIEKVGPTFYERVFRAKPVSKFTVLPSDALYPTCRASASNVVVTSSDW
jgi:hypothetical protein